ITDFGRYLRPDIAVITAITPEHMEFFQTMEAVAREELAAANFSKLAIINRDDIDGQYAGFLSNPNVTTYGTSDLAEYKFKNEFMNVQRDHQGVFIAPEFPQPIQATIQLLGEHSLRPAIAAATVAVKLGMSPQEIAAGLAAIKPVPGRMNVLDGLQGSTIIDDTYNSSPAAAKSAIETLLSMNAPQKIVILGTMSELGALSAEEHTKLGRMFTPDNVDWVITVGEDAEKYLASSARANGAQVKSFRNSVEAGGFAHSVLQDGALILVKG